MEQSVYAARLCRELKSGTNEIIGVGCFIHLCVAQCINHYYSTDLITLLAPAAPPPRRPPFIADLTNELMSVCAIIIEGIRGT